MNNIVSFKQYTNPLAVKCQASDPDAMLRMVGELQKAPEYQRRVAMKMEAERRAREDYIRTQRDLLIEEKEVAEFKLGLMEAAVAVSIMGSALLALLV